MLNILVAGFGKMGRLVVDSIQKQEDMQVVMIADGTQKPDLSTLQEELHAIIDFSHPANLEWIAPYVKAVSYTHLYDPSLYSHLPQPCF